MDCSTLMAWRFQETNGTKKKHLAVDRMTNHWPSRQNQLPTRHADTKDDVILPKLEEVATVVCALCIHPADCVKREAAARYLRANK